MIRRILILDEEPAVKQPQPDTKLADRTLDDSVVSATSNRSPFQRVKKHVKQIITGERERECVREPEKMSMLLVCDLMLIAVCAVSSLSQMTVPQCLSIIISNYKSDKLEVTCDRLGDSIFSLNLNFKLGFDN